MYGCTPHCTAHDIGAGKENLCGRENRKYSNSGDFKIKQLQDDSLFLAARSISSRLWSQKPSSDAFDSVAEVHVGQYLQVISSCREVCNACAACGDYDSEIVEHLVGQIVRISLIDASDNSVQVEVANEQAFPFYPFQWISVKALRPASSWLTLCRAGRPKEALAAFSLGDSVDLEIATFVAKNWLQEANPSKRRHWHTIGCRNERWHELLLEEVARLLGCADFVVWASPEHLKIARQAIQRGYAVADGWIDHVFKAIAIEADDHHRRLLQQIAMLHPNWRDLKEKFLNSQKNNSDNRDTDTGSAGAVENLRQPECKYSNTAIQLRATKTAGFFNDMLSLGDTCFLVWGHARQQLLRAGAMGSAKHSIDFLFGWSFLFGSGLGLSLFLSYGRALSFRSASWE
mmetsp:Transcript_115274/g.181432  ORF Transcript_115274/g.181432 Transcript_115274/m.181432 type:complete len:402 (+) Transcript_115274:97-1302(+)